jgi:hypothetical protein
MPFKLAIAFQRSQSFAVDSNRYLNGEYQANVLTSTSRKRWTLSSLLTAVQTDAIRSFYTSQGPTEFYFYDVYETSPIFSYDMTGVAITGRYTVRFEGALGIALTKPRNKSDLSLVEVA